MENKQTAVEWLGINLNALFTEIPTEMWEEITIVFQQAKAIERIQIIYAYDDGANERHNDPVTGEQYYKETYEQ